MKDLSPLLNQLIAHRGLHDKYIKDNSIMAIDLCVLKNIPVEFDVTLTSDNKVVVCHDSFIECEGKRYLISKHSYQFLKKRCTELVTLSDLLNLISGQIPILIELKPYNKGHKLEKECVKILDMYNGYFAIQSFNPLIVYWFKKNRPQFLRGQLLTDAYPSNLILKIIYKYMLFNKFTNPDFICYNVKGLPNKQIDKFRCHKPVIGWTIKNESQLIMYSVYCDNFICDNIVK